MRRFILLGLLAILALPASGSRRVTVAQLEKELTVASQKHRADADLVRHLADIVLTERLTDSTRNRISTTLHLGPKVTLALQLLADESAALDPPPAELPAGNPPDAETEKRMLNAARDYVTRTLPHLPDFFATRTTYSFDNTPQILKENEWPVPAGLHLVGTSSREITFRDDTEVSTPAGEAVKAASPPAAGSGETGLQTRGEFGATLGIVLIDMANGEVTFDHWEKSPVGLVAVYRYTVPKAASHYKVDYCCIPDGPRGVTSQGGRRRASAAQLAKAEPNATTVFHKIPGYHGSLFIDPATGAILRITLEAVLDEGSPIARVAIVIEYGSVTIGDRKFICPLRSMALTESPAAPDPANPIFSAPPLMQVNETTFTGYHRLGSTIRIIPGAEVPPSAPHP
jgi:hypothetical protein